MELLPKERRMSVVLRLSSRGLSRKVFPLYLLSKGSIRSFLPPETHTLWRQPYFPAGFTSGRSLILKPISQSVLSGQLCFHNFLCFLLNCAAFLLKSGVPKGFGSGKPNPIRVHSLFGDPCLVFKVSPIIPIYQAWTYLAH